MRRGAVVVLVLVAATLAPMWFVALHGEPPSEEIQIDQRVTEIRPLEGFLDTPNKLAPSQVGVIVWIALFGLVAVLAAAHRFMNEAVRPDGEPGGDGEPAVADGGHRRPSWFETDDRTVASYHPAGEDVEGILAMGGLTVLAIVFAALFTGEYLTLARTQYFGAYAAGMFLSLALLTVAYYAWFVPHVTVAERREH